MPTSKVVKFIPKHQQQYHNPHLDQSQTISIHLTPLISKQNQSNGVRKSINQRPTSSNLQVVKMERQPIRWAAAILLCMVVLAGAASAAPEPASKPSNRSPAETVNQVQAILAQVWEVVAPWVQWAKSVGRDVFAVVYERASLQGVKSVAAEASRIALDFFSGRPYQAAYEVARDVPGAGRAVKEVVGEANLRKKAAREQAEEHKEL